MLRGAARIGFVGRRRIRASVPLRASTRDSCRLRSSYEPRQFPAVVNGTSTDFCRHGLIKRSVSSSVAHVFFTCQRTPASHTADPYKMLTELPRNFKENPEIQERGVT